MRRFCELIDPSCPQYNQGYCEVIVREAHRTREETDMRLASYHPTSSGKPVIEGGKPIVIPTDCCGGGMPPGVFDKL